MKEEGKFTCNPKENVYPSTHDYKKDTDVEGAFIGTRIHLECPVIVGGKEMMGHVFRKYYGWEGYTDRLCPTQRLAGIEYGLDGNSRPIIKECVATAKEFDFFTESKKFPEKPKDDK